MTAQSSCSLDEQRLEFPPNRFLAMPIAVTFAWTIIGIAGACVHGFGRVDLVHLYRFDLWAWCSFSSPVSA